MEVFNQKLKILIDTNIFLDIFQKRGNFIDPSTKILNLVYEQKIDGIVAAHSIPNLWYILRKTHTEEERRHILRAVCTQRKSVSKSKRTSVADRMPTEICRSALGGNCSIAEKSTVDLAIKSSIDGTNIFNAAVDSPNFFFR